MLPETISDVDSYLSITFGDYHVISSSFTQRRAIAKAGIKLIQKTGGNLVLASGVTIIMPVVADLEYELPPKFSRGNS
jgi:hypothetical protein